MRANHSSGYFHEHISVAAEAKIRFSRFQYAVKMSLGHEVLVTDFAGVDDAANRTPNHRHARVWAACENSYTTGSPDARAARNAVSSAYMPPICESRRLPVAALRDKPVFRVKIQREAAIKIHRDVFAKVCHLRDLL